MFKKSIEAIIADGMKKLKERSASLEGETRRAQEEVVRCAGEIQTLVTLAKQVPEKIFDRYSNVMVATAEIVPNDSPRHWIQLGHARGPFDLRGFMGDDTIKPGKYRVVVLLEPIDVR